MFWIKIWNFAFAIIIIFLVLESLDLVDVFDSAKSYLAFLIISIIIWPTLVYGALVSVRNRVQESQADIDVQLKRRHDLIPNLVSTVQGYAAHEKGTLEKVTEARTKAISGGNFEQKAQSENLLTSALKSVFAVAENYPDLKASDNFKELQLELSDTENKIQSARRFYNSTVQSYNTSIQTPPVSFVNDLMGFHEKEFFDLDANPEQRENIEVKF